MWTVTKKSSMFNCRPVQGNMFLSSRSSLLWSTSYFSRFRMSNCLTPMSAWFWTCSVVVKLISFEMMNCVRPGAFWLQWLTVYNGNISNHIRILMAGIRFICRPAFLFRVYILCVVIVLSTTWPKSCTDNGSCFHCREEQYTGVFVFVWMTFYHISVIYWTFAPQLECKVLLRD